MENTPIIPLYVYCVYSTNNKILLVEFDDELHFPETRLLKAGWNAVGLSAEEHMTAKATFFKLDWRSYLSWNKEEQKYNSVIQNGGVGRNSDENLVRLWNGGWLYMDSDGTYLGNA